MNLDKESKKELKKILAGFGDESDAREISMLETDEFSSSLEKSNKELQVAIARMSSLYHKAFSDMNKGFMEGLKSLKTNIEESKKAGTEPDWSGFFKDMPTMLTQIGTHTKDTSDLIRNLKWNASQQLRDVSGSPINPSIAGFGITATYDTITLSDYDGDGNVGTVQYYQTDQLKAQLSLTYDAGNLIEVERIL